MSISIDFTAKVLHRKPFMDRVKELAEAEDYKYLTYGIIREKETKIQNSGMEIKVIEGAFSVCRLKELGQAMIEDDLYFLGRTDEEISLVCRTESVPQDTAAREDGWRAFRIQGELDFF